MKRFCVSKYVALTCLLFVTSLTAVRMLAQSNISTEGEDCGEPVTSMNDDPNHAGAVEGWPQGTLVRVNIVNNGQWNDSQVSAIRQAVESWNGVGNVVLQVAVNDSTISGLNAITIDSAHLSEPGEIHGVFHAQTFTSTDDDTHLTTNASMSLNEYMTDLNDLAKTTSHEIGHTFGLADNESNPNSVMADGCRSLNGNECGSSAPTGADVNAADCEDQYSGNSCFPTFPSATTCTCEAGSAANCSPGETCVNGYCGCLSICDSSYCPGYDVCTCNPSAPGCNPDCPSICSSFSCPGFDLCICDPEACFGLCTNPCDPSCPQYDPYQC